MSRHRHGGTLSQRYGHAAKKAVSVTANERAVLLAIANSEYQDAAKPEDLIDHDVWSEYIGDDSGVKAIGLHGKALSAVFSSLQKKGLVRTGNMGPTGRLAGHTVSLTVAGVALSGWQPR